MIVVFSLGKALIFVRANTYVELKGWENRWEVCMRRGNKKGDVEDAFLTFVSSLACTTFICTYIIISAAVATTAPL